MDPNLLLALLGMLGQGGNSFSPYGATPQSSTNGLLQMLSGLFGNSFDQSLGGGYGGYQGYDNPQGGYGSYAGYGGGYGGNNAASALFQWLFGPQAQQQAINYQQTQPPPQYYNPNPPPPPPPPPAQGTVPAGYHSGAAANMAGYGAAAGYGGDIYNSQHLGELPNNRNPTVAEQQQWTGGPMQQLIPGQGWTQVSQYQPFVPAAPPPGWKKGPPDLQPGYQMPSAWGPITYLGGGLWDNPANPSGPTHPYRPTVSALPGHADYGPHRDYGAPTGPGVDPNTPPLTYTGAPSAYKGPRY